MTLRNILAGKLNGMEYKNYEEWDADGLKIQADLEDAGQKMRQGLIEAGKGDEEAAKAAVQWEDEFNRLLEQSEDHMKKMPPKTK